MIEFLQRVPKKAIAAVITALIVFLNESIGLGIDEDTVNQIVAVAVAYIVGQGIADHGKAPLQEQAKIAKKVENEELPVTALPASVIKEFKEKTPESS